MASYVWFQFGFRFYSVLGKGYFTHLDIGTKAIGKESWKSKAILAAVAFVIPALMDKLTVMRRSFRRAQALAEHVRSRERLLLEVCRPRLDKSRGIGRGSVVISRSATKTGCSQLSTKKELPGCLTTLDPRFTMPGPHAEVLLRKA